jgi:hypothetical protein
MGFDAGDDPARTCRAREVRDEIIDTPEILLRPGAKPEPSHRASGEPREERATRQRLPRRDVGARIVERFLDHPNELGVERLGGGRRVFIFLVRACGRFRGSSGSRGK